MKQIDVTILGQVYRLGCPEGGEALLRDAVAAVDREMTGIRDAGKVKARERIAVLAALNLAYQLAEGGPSASASSAAHAQAHDTTAQPADPADANQADKALGELVRRIDEVLKDDGHLL